MSTFHISSNLLFERLYGISLLCNVSHCCKLSDTIVAFDT